MNIRMNFAPLAKKAGSALLVFALVLSTFVVTSVVNVADADHQPGHCTGGLQWDGNSCVEKLVICHATGNGYVVNNPSRTADAGGHAGEGHQSGNDIIPPFNYDGGSFPGQNWTTDLGGYTGEDVYNNECNVPEVEPATLTIEKNLINDDAGTSVESDFSFTVNGGSPISFEGDGSNQIELAPGTYTIVEVEANSNGYVTSYQNCSNIDLSAGGSATCTITNDDEDVVSVPGCMDPGALNYDDEATEDDQSCTYPTVTICKYDPQENLLSGWSVSLTQGEDVYDGVTGENGCVVLEDVPLGDYTLDEVLQEGWSNVFGKGSEVVVDEADETFNLVNEAIIPELGSISGWKENWDTSERLSGWTIFIDENDNQTLDEGEESRVTDENGEYSFENLEDGTYTVCEVHQTGWEQYSPSPEEGAVNGCYVFVIEGGNDITDARFCNHEIPTYIIDGYKFNDENGNGIWDEGEQGLSGWTINLLQGEEVVATDVTDENGYYSFEVEAGSYEVEEVQQQGWTQTAPEVGSCIFETVGGLQVLLEDSAEPEYTCDFGNHFDPEAPLCSISVNDSEVSAGTEVTITWETTNVNSVSIDQGIGAVDPDGSTNFTIENDITFTLTASNTETEESVQCQVSVDEQSGGGGGGGGGKRISMSSRDNDDEPEGEVLGEQTAVLPAGAPNTGAGGMAPNGASHTGSSVVVAILSGVASRRKN